MKYISFLLLLFVFASCRHSKTGSGNIISETRNIGSFNSITASGAINVELKAGATQAVVVETDDNIMPYVETSVSNGTLKVRLRDINNLSNSTVHIYVTIPQVAKLNASASAEITSTGTVTGNKIDLDASSAAKINITLDAPSVTASASSGAEITAAGRTKSVEASASSGASVSAQELHAENATANASSGASLTVFASVGIDGTASSGGEVRYTGGAASKKINESSGGSVRSE